MAWSFNVLGASSVTTATTSLSFNVVDSVGATVSGVQVKLNGTGLTYDASTGTIAGTITGAQLYDTVGSAAIQTLTLPTAHTTTVAAELSTFLSHALTFQTQLTTWGVDLTTFKSFGTPVDYSSHVTDPSTSPPAPYGDGSVLRIPVLNGSGTIVNYLQIIGSQVDANKPGMNEYVQTVELLQANGTSYGTPKIADYTGAEYSAAGTEMLVSQIAYGANGDWGTVFGVLASGNDTYVVNSASTYVVDAGLGNDTITGSSGSDTLDFTYATGGVKVDMTHKNASNVSDPTAEFTDPVLGTKFTQHFSGIEHVTGSLYSDNIIADSGNNYLFGGYDLAQDSLNGGAGIDTLTGGAGNDTYKIIDLLDVISENVSGTDLVEAYVSYDISTLTGIENLTLYGSATDATGNSLANVITGTASANLIDGGTGADTMIGNFGDDTYKVDNSNDVVTEGSGLGSGIDVVITTTSFALTYGGEVEILKTDKDTGGADIDLTGDHVANTITGNSGSNKLDGGANGADGQTDTLNGLLGDDTYVLGTDSDTVVDTGGKDTITSSSTRSLASYAGADAAHAIENLTLTGTSSVDATGNQYDNELKGNSANNTFTGGAGNDTFTGGAGTDSFVWEANGKDVITDFRATYFTVALDKNGVVGSPASTSTATGTASVVLNLAGNQADIDLTAAGIDWLTANTATNTVRGVAVYTGATNANGASSHDVLNDGTNKTILVADHNIKDNWKSISAGDKTNLLADGMYLRVDTVGSNSAGSNGAIRGQITKVSGSTFDDVIDVSGLRISEFATIQAIASASGTSDTVLTRYSNNATHQLLLENVAKADLLASQFVFSTTLSNDTVTGTAYADDLFGGQGNDTLSGGAGVDRLFGEADNDYINGGTGNDLMYGGAGDDTFVVDSISDKIYDASGSDTIISSVTFTLATTALAGVEDLQASGTGNINLVGNAQANTITGNSGNNLLDGKAGIDALNGGGGNDSYYVDNASDTVTDSAGTDVVAAAVSYTLAANVAIEKLMTYNNTIQVVNGANVLVPIDMNLTGNNLAQAVIGNGKINVINGGGGNDTLTGGAGKDVFVFNTALDAAGNKDTITDFSPTDDTIKLENTGAGLFNALGTGTLAATRFYTGTAAHDADDRIIYNKTTGVLSYDADGTGATAAVAFAVIANKTALTNLDFVVI